MAVSILETIVNTPLITIPNSNRKNEGQVLFKYEICSIVWRCRQAPCR